MMPGNLPFRGSWARKALAGLQELWAKFGESGRGTELARVVQAVDDRLRREPLDFGEVYRSRGVVDEHLPVQEFLAVDKVRGFVLVRDCRALSGTDS